MANVLAAVAQYQTEVRTERVRAVQAVSRKRGGKWGGSMKGRRWKVTKAQLTAISVMKAAGKLVTQMASVTALSRPTIYRLFQLGEASYGRTYTRISLSLSRISIATKRTE